MQILKNVLQKKEIVQIMAKDLRFTFHNSNSFMRK